MLETWSRILLLCLALSLYLPLTKQVIADIVINCSKYNQQVHFLPLCVCENHSLCVWVGGWVLGCVRVRVGGFMWVSLFYLLPLSLSLWFLFFPPISFSLFWISPTFFIHCLSLRPVYFFFLTTSKFLMGHSRPLFVFFRLFNSSQCICSLWNNADDWIRTTDLWHWKRPLCRLSYNHSPILSLSTLSNLNFSNGLLSHPYQLQNARVVKKKLKISLSMS